MPLNVRTIIAYLSGFVGTAVLAAAILLAFDVYASPGFALSATLLKLCGL